MSMKGKITIGSDVSAERARIILQIIDQGLLPEDLRLVVEQLVGRAEEVRGKVEGALQSKTVEGESVENVLSSEQQTALLKSIQGRFEANPKRHQGIKWAQVQSRLQQAPPEKLWSLNEMERTGGEPDVVGVDRETGQVIFNDCSKESPQGRSNLVYDRAAQEALKERYPDEVSLKSG